jgi:signal transduction histidine kinase
MVDVATVGRRSGPPRHQRPAPSMLWRNYIAVGAVVALAYLVIPAPQLPLQVVIFKVLLYGSVSASAVVFMIVGVRRHRPANATPWLVLIAAQVIYLAADLTFYTLHFLMESDAYPSPADALYLGHYPLVIIGVLLLVRSRARGSDLGSLLDAIIIGTGFGVLSLVFLIEPNVDTAGVPLLTRLVSAAYPVMDVLVLAVSARLVVGPGPRQTAFWLFTASLAVLLATDTAYAYAQTNGLYQINSLSGKLLDAGWLTFYLLLGASALHPSMRTLVERDLRTRSRVGSGRLVFLAGAVVLAPIAVVLENMRGEHGDTSLIAIICGILFVMVVYRMSGLVRDVESSSAQLRERSGMLQSTLAELERAEAERTTLLDKTMRGAEQERTRLAAELHDGPIQRLTALGYQLEQAALTLRRGDEQRAKLLLGNAQRGLRGEVDELRGLMTTLRPPVLDERGLALALTDELDTFERHTGIVCTLQSHHDARLEPEVETVLYRVVQEALANIAKHSNASHVWVYLRTDDDQVDMHVRDDGDGFDAGRVGVEAVDHGHFGLAGMRHRVEMAAGSYHLLSAPGRGTSIFVQVPRRRVSA